MKVNYYENFKYVKSTSAFKIYIIMMLLVNVYCSFAIARTAFVGLLPFVESIVAIMNFSYYHVFEIVSILFINFQTIKFFKDNQFQLIRLKDKKTSIDSQFIIVLFAI